MMTTNEIKVTKKAIRKTLVQIYKKYDFIIPEPFGKAVENEVMDYCINNKYGAESINEEFLTGVMLCCYRFRAEEM